jgi:glucan-binding YG repeat protein
MNTLSKVLIGAGAVAVGYQLYKLATKPKGAPKGTEQKSNLISTNTKNVPLGQMRYDSSSRKVFKLINDKGNPKWVLLNETQQPKALDWFNYNGKWVWVKWNGKLDI